jgi:hypothetical protein
MREENCFEPLDTDVKWLGEAVKAETMFELGWEAERRAHNFD